jgi:hypothetical protein
MKSVNLLVFVIVWYGVLYVWRNPDVLPSDGVSSKPLSNPLYWILFSVPLFSFVYTLYDLANGFRERSIVFDGVSRTITKGARTLAHFADVDAIHIKEITTQDDVVAEYQLSVCLKTIPSLVIAISDDYYAIAGVASDISNLLHVNVTKTDKQKNLSILGWAGSPTETKIKLPYTPNSLTQVLQWGLHPSRSGYTHQDIVEWCDNFYCDYIDNDAQPDIERLIPVLMEIREQWDSLVARQPNSTGANAISLKNLSIPPQRFRDWLRQIKL